MGLSSLSSRAIKGRLFHDLMVVPDDWVNSVSGEPVNSNQEIETHVGVGNVASLREWIGPRLAKRLKTFQVIIANKKYEDTLEVLGEEMRRDKTGQVEKRIKNLVDRYNQHWAELITAGIESNPTAYDGVAYFATTHSEQDSGTQINLVTQAGGVVPTTAGMETAILTMTKTLLKLKDNVGKPMNAGASSFRISVPIDLLPQAAAALRAPLLIDAGGPRTNVIQVLGEFTYKLSVNSLLTSAVRMYMFIDDGNAWIRQTEIPLQIGSKDETSEYFFDNDAMQFGLMTSRGHGPANWQKAVRLEFTA